MKNKIKKFGAFLMALMLIFTSMSNVSVVKAFGEDKLDIKNDTVYLTFKNFPIPYVNENGRYELSVDGGYNSILIDFILSLKTYKPFLKLSSGNMLNFPEGVSKIIVPRSHFSIKYSVPGGNRLINNDRVSYFVIQNPNNLSGGKVLYVGEEELAKAKEEAKKEINSNPNLTNADKDKYAKDIDNAKTVKEVRDILDEAKKKAEAKINENDPEYLKNKLKKLIEEAKRARYPSEELEEAIDEAYDILLDRYSRIEDYKYAIENLERILQNMRDTRRNRFKLDVDDLNEKDEELTGKTETKWYIDVYNGKKRILSGQANYKGDFVIEIKKGKIKAKDTLKVVATDPQNDKKYKEVEIEVGGDSKETKDNNPTFNINDLLQADGSKPLTDLAVFPVGKSFYNVVQNGQKTTVYMDVKTFISGNRTMLPIRYIAYTLGFNVEYDNFTREAIFSNTENSALAKKTIRVNIDTGLMKDSYGNVFASDVRPVLINNRIHASIANIARMFEASQGTIEDGINQTIEWDSARKAVYVFKNIK